MKLSIDSLYDAFTIDVTTAINPAIDSGGMLLLSQRNHQMGIHYAELQPIEGAVAEKLLSSRDASEVSNALIRMALFSSDWQWVQNKCIVLAHHPDVNVRRTSALCFGHIARIHGKLDLIKVLPILNSLLKDPEVAGIVQDAFDDIRLFIPEESR